MAPQLFKKTKQLEFGRSYDVPLATAWRAWTEPAMLRQWWGGPRDEVGYRAQLDKLDQLLAAM